MQFSPSGQEVFERRLSHYCFSKLDRTLLSSCREEMYRCSDCERTQNSSRDGSDDVSQGCEPFGY